MDQDSVLARQSAHDIDGRLAAHVAAGQSLPALTAVGHGIGLVAALEVNGPLVIGSHSVALSTVEGVIRVVTGPGAVVAGDFTESPRAA